MQFRVSDNKRRVQCLAAIYDKDSKRTRQKLVWTIDHYDPCQQRPAPHALAAAGTIEQREKWSSDIARYLDELDERGRLNKLQSGIPIVANIMSTIIDDLSRHTPKLTEEERQRVSALVLGWAEALNILPPPVESRQAKRAPTGSRAELIREAQRLRDAGYSIRAVVEAMTAAGNKVSRSWVQEQTSRS